MPKIFKCPHEGIPYHLVKKPKKPWMEPGCYQLHTPSECRLKFPETGKFIHKCERPKYAYKQIPEITGFRNLLLKRTTKTYYPTVMHRSDYERLQQQAKMVTQEEEIEAMKAHEAQVQKLAKESEKRKNALKANLKPQPGAPGVETGDRELDGPDQAAHTLSRAEILIADGMPGPAFCNRIILASKAHAIRDAQVLEKELMKQELDEEERRLDKIMEENRQMAIKRADEEEQRRHRLRLQNLDALKEQIKAHEAAKVMESERIEEESIRVNQANIAMQIDEAKKLKEKHHCALKLKEMLDQGSADLLFYKQLQNEEERISDLRIANFLKQKMERESRNKKEAEAIKAAKQKGIDHIAKAQKAEQELKEELHRIRDLKIREDVERECRRKERAAAIKRKKDMLDLNIAREAQIKDIQRTIAREIARDEQNFNNVARENEEFFRKEKLLEDKRKAIIEKHRQDIMKQINDKERARAEMREMLLKQGVALRMEQDNLVNYENKIIKMKVAAMREQKIPEKYVKEVEQSLGKHGYLT